MNSVLEVVVLVLLGVMGIYVSSIASRLERLERTTGAFLDGLTLSNKVRELAAGPDGRLLAIQALREEWGVDLRIAKAVVDSLRLKR